MLAASRSVLVFVSNLSPHNWVLVKDQLKTICNKITVPNLTFFKVNFVLELPLDQQRHTFSVVHVSVTNCLLLTHFNNNKKCLDHATRQWRNEQNKQDEWDIRCSVTVEVNMKAFQKTRNRPAIPSVLLLASYLKDSKWTHHRNTCRSMLNAAPLTITRK